MSKSARESQRTSTWSSSPRLPMPHRNWDSSCRMNLQFLDVAGLGQEDNDVHAVNSNRGERFAPPNDRGIAQGAVLLNELTEVLNAIDRGDPKAADQLLPLVYEELRKLAAQ